MTVFSGEESEESLREYLDAFPPESAYNKGGRPTVTDDSLAFSRNQWCFFFETCWPEVGWPLLQIRKRKGSTLKNVQNVFKKVDDKALCGHANAFLRGEPQHTTVAALRKQRIASTKLRYELEDMKRAHPELERACAEAKSAIEQATETNKSAIQLEAANRRRLLDRNARKIKAQTTKYLALESTLRNQETFLYCSELLDFLRGRRRALKPINLANALAGVPHMRWRQSNERCSKISEDAGVQHPYAIFQLIARVSRRIGERRGELSVASVQMELMKLPKK